MKLFLPPVAAVLLLGGCNMVQTSQPMLRPEQASGPQPRSGIWGREGGNCWYVAKAPVYRWPGCAMPLIVRDGTALSYEADGSQSWESTPIFLVGQGPQVMQIESRSPKSETGEDSVSYFYAGVRVLTQDAEGRATRLRFWLLSCGPDAPPKSGVVTLKPWPGIVLAEDGKGCEPASAQGLQDAVAASEPTAPRESITLRWVRDSYP